MEKDIMNNPNTYVMDEEVIEQAVTSALDISKETATILSMTPRDGYQKKLDLIYFAEDLSTKVKLEEICRAEDKYIQDLERSAETCKGIMWVKAGIVGTIIAGGIWIVSSPDGQKIMKRMFKRSA